jgi:AcrR family transcriptional regulator
MGHREKLLAGAKSCLYEKGYARTTARDIVAASGTNLGSIGYHYGSVEALLTAALMEGFEEWGAELAKVLSTDADGGPREQLEARWTRVIETFETHRQLWVASFEAFTQAQRSPALREQLAAAYEEARPWVAAMLLNIDESAVDERTARTVGSFFLAVQAGLAAQWLLDPEHSPSAADLVEALRPILAMVESDEQTAAESLEETPAAT